MNYNPNSVYKTYSTTGKLSIYKKPIVEVNNTDIINDEIITKNSNNLLILTGTTYNFFFSFNFENELDKINTKGFRYEIYKFNPKTKYFNQKIYVSEIFYNIDNLGQEFPLSNLNLDGDYIIKTYFNYKDNKLFKNSLFKDGNGDTGKIKKGLEYGFYNKKEDNYFIGLRDVEKPSLFSNTPVSIEKDVIRNIILEPKGEKVFNIEEKINGEVIITLNGLVLAKNYDFTFKNNQLKLKGNSREGDIINIFYTSRGESLTVEIIDVVDINNNPKVNFNKEKNRFELYVTKGLAGKKEIITLNGLVLTPNIDYVRSISNDNRIIMMGEIRNNDIINIIYNPKLSLTGNIESLKPSLGWYLKRTPKNEKGKFILEIAKNNDFNNIIFKKDIPYQEGVSVYKTNLDFNLETFTDYFYRVKNIKTHTTINGSLIDLEKISDVYNFKIINNQINSY